MFKPITVLFFLALSTRLVAATYQLPEDGSNIIGRSQYHVVKHGETFAEIAKNYDVGFLTLMAANPGVDPYLPDADLAIKLPTSMILPQVPRTGIVINLAELRLYYFDELNREVHVFPVGIGEIGRDTPEMETYINEKKENPTWTPPQSIRDRYLAKGIELPAIVAAGPNNPLGDYAMRLAYGYGQYLIHGTNKEFGIGLRVSSGCIRMEPINIKWLFERVAVETKVTIINQPIKFSIEPNYDVYIEVHEPLTDSNGEKPELVIPKDLAMWLNEFGGNQAKIKALLTAKNGLPTRVVTQ